MVQFPRKMTDRSAVPPPPLRAVVVSKAPPMYCRRSYNSVVMPKPTPSTAPSHSSLPASGARTNPLLLTRRPQNNKFLDIPYREYPSPSRRHRASRPQSRHLPPHSPKIIHTSEYSSVSCCCMLRVCDRPGGSRDDIRSSRQSQREVVVEDGAVAQRHQSTVRIIRESSSYGTAVRTTS